MKYNGRESLVMAIDMLGKWSLMDTVILIMMVIGKREGGRGIMFLCLSFIHLLLLCGCVAFRLHLPLPQDGHLAGHPISMDIIVIPEWGFYGLVLLFTTRKIENVLRFFNFYNFNF